MRGFIGALVIGGSNRCKISVTSTLAHSEVKVGRIVSYPNLVSDDNFFVGGWRVCPEIVNGADPVVRI